MDASHRTRYILTVITVVGIVVITAIGVLMGDAISEFAKNILLTVLGVLISEYKQITSFTFGSTQTNKDKDATIAALSGAASTTPQPTQSTPT